MAINLLDSNQSPGILLYKSPFGTWLHDAASYGRLGLVKYLIDVGIDINLKGGTLGGNALNAAVSAESLSVVNLLIENGAEMDISNSENNPLFSAILKNNLTLVKKLIDHGIDFRHIYERNLSPKIEHIDAEAFAIERGNNDIAQYIHSKKSKNV